MVRAQPHDRIEQEEKSLVDERDASRGLGRLAGMTFLSLPIDVAEWY